MNLLIVEMVADQPSTHWRIESEQLNGTSAQFIQYGKVPRSFRQVGLNKALHIGQLYRVDVLASGGGGYRYFLLRPDTYSDIMITDLEIAVSTGNGQ
ncbi:hypothetical protein [uncultured Sphingomonas sp.]|uniref:hypothetical protein n=1 Tax=uncultured Sphingomonas sp. TaxID=158754 RepID=UPI0035CA8593